MKKNLKALHKEFMREQKFVKGLAMETLKGYQSVFDLLLKIVPDIDLGNISPENMVLFFERLEKRKRMIGKNLKIGGIKKSTIATYRNKLKKFFEWLRIRKFIESNPFDEMAYPSVSYENIKALENKIVEKIFFSISLYYSKNPFIKKRELAIFSLFLNTGIRRNELLNIKILDLNIEKRLLYVNGETSKSRRDRTISLNEEAMNFLTDYLKEIISCKKTTPYLFASFNRDDKLTVHGLKHIVEKIKKLSKTNFHVHQFRHTFAINYLSVGGQLEELKQNLGHTDIKMTEKYIRYIPQKNIRPKMEKLGIGRTY